ncbi:hypothetical protein KAW65_01345 [candidate division WOR-3 bacterium]|nr:hypothetical protein [candidate division WOR-3 bacterium]
MWTYIIVAIFFIICVIIANSRKWYSVIKGKSSNLPSFTTNQSQEIVMDRIISKAEQSKYTIEVTDRERGRIILSEGISGWSWGFFYPIYISNEDGLTLIETGIRSRLIQIGPIPRRHHRRCIEFIKSSIKG